VKRASAVLSVLAAALLALTACSSSSSTPSKGKPSELQGDPKTGKYMGSGLIPPQPRPSFTLTDTSGKTFAFGTQTSGHPTFLYFGYTNCPDECPASLADIATATRHASPAVAARTYVVFVTTDVKHDTGPVIKRWLANFAFGRGVTVVGLHGTQAQLDTAQAASHIPLAEDGGETHSTSTLLYGKDDYAHVLFLRSNDEDKAMTHDLRLIGSGK
jgi:protein SCO1/2